MDPDEASAQCGCKPIQGRINRDGGGLSILLPFIFMPWQPTVPAAAS
jgi:hypothetical protein